MKKLNSGLLPSNVNAFASTFYFFADTQATAKKIKRACKLTHRDTATLTRHYFGRTEAQTDNKGFKEIGGSVVNWSFLLLIKCSGRRQFTAPKPQLLKPPKR